MRGALLLLATALALTLAMAAPVLEAPSERLFGSEIVGRHHDAYTMVHRFERPSWHPFSQPATDLPGALLARWLGGVGAYNALVLASFPLAALFAFLLGRHLGLPRWAAGLAGLAFAFAPSHLAHAAYHPHVAQIQWIPLCLLTLLRCLDRWTPARAALLLLAFGLVTLANFYSGLFMALLVPVVLIAYRPPAGCDSAGSGWRPTAATLVAGGLAGWFYLRQTAGPFAELAQRFAFPAVDLGRYSARWYSYLLPPVNHPLAGERLWALWRRSGVGDGLVEQQLTLGLGLLVLAAVAVWRRAEPPTGRGVPLLVSVGAAALVASLAPPAIAGPWPALPLPATLLHGILPMFRAYARLGIFVQLAVALLAGAGAASLMRQGRWARPVALLLLFLAAIELAPFPPWRWHHVLPTRGHRWMATVPAPWRLLDCARRPPAVARSIVQFLPQPASLLSAKLSDCGEPGLAARLAAKGYSHLLLRADTAAYRWYAERPLPKGLVEERRFEDSRLLRVVAEPGAIHVEEWSGFSWREYAGARTFRWLGRSGNWHLANAGGVAAEGRLELELWSLGDSRDLALQLDGETVATIRVGAEPALHTVGPMRLEPGRHLLAWRPRGPATIADRLLGNGDLRPLTVAVGGWRWLPSPSAARPAG